MDFQDLMGKIQMNFWAQPNTGQHWSRSDSDREEPRTCGWAGLRTALHIRSVWVIKDLETLREKQCVRNHLPPRLFRVSMTRTVLEMQPP